MLSQKWKLQDFRQFKFAHASGTDYSIAPVMKVPFRLSICRDKVVREFVLT